ncbi:MAG TPA: NADH-quinone oxidoreductase subunit NuoH [Acidobacteriota bacterium]|nr:NADH-quinone oxidoreductase subunit NuoH [Acidobacteriota bacterium]
MATAERKLWPWQIKRSVPLGRRIAQIIKGLIILGIAVGLPVSSIAAFPIADSFVYSMFGEGAFQLGIATGVKGVLLLVVIFTSVAYLTLAERRFAGLIQLRRGPNRVGWFGFLQPAADGIKFFFKEDIIPENVHKPLYLLAPIIIFTPALTVFSVIPFGPGSVGANPYQLASVNVGILLIFALSSLGIYGIALGGWASFSKWSLLGGLRASAQMISYEVSLAMAAVGVLVFAGSFDLTALANTQAGYWLGFIPKWNMFPQFLGFIVFVVAVFAETNRLPFDLAEAEQELVGGYHTEYSSMKFALFMLGEYANMITGSALITLLFLGGWHVPYLEFLALPAWIAVMVQIFGFFLKLFLLCFLFIWVRWTLPRFRYDQLMNLGWKIMLPIALLNVILTAVVVAFV